jgi:hypothetical protein
MILAVESPIFQPAMRIVTAITQADQASVTTSFDHDYIDGTIIRFHIPPRYGMYQIDTLFSPITVTGPTTFTVDIDTRNFDAFIVPADPRQYAQVVAIGEDNEILTAAEQNVLP